MKRCQHCGFENNAICTNHKPEDVIAINGMSIENLDPIPPGNPFLYDYWNMGTVIGSNVTVMYGKHQDKKHDYIIIVNTETGQRLRINLDEINHPDNYQKDDEFYSLPMPPLTQLD